MAGLPQNFQAISNVLANYNFVDIASGTGYINFYAGNTSDLKLLTNNKFYSNAIYEIATGASLNYVLVLDHDFDVLLNRPLDLKGFVIVNIPLVLYSQGVAARVDLYATVILRKWDGANETDIVSNDSIEYEIINVARAPFYYMSAIDLNIPLTHFKKGETLRLRINIYNKTEKNLHDGGYRYVGFVTPGHNGKNGMRKMIPKLRTTDQLENIIDQNHVQLFLFGDDYLGRKQYFINLVPGILYGITDNFSVFFNVCSCFYF